MLDFVYSMLLIMFQSLYPICTSNRLIDSVRESISVTEVTNSENVFGDESFFGLTNFTDLLVG